MPTIWKEVLESDWFRRNNVGHLGSFLLKGNRFSGRVRPNEEEVAPRGLKANFVFPDLLPNYSSDVLQKDNLSPLQKSPALTTHRWLSASLTRLLLVRSHVHVSPEGLLPPLFHLTAPKPDLHIRTSSISDTFTKPWQCKGFFCLMHSWEAGELSESPITKKEKQY